MSGIFYPTDNNSAQNFVPAGSPLGQVLDNACPYVEGEEGWNDYLIETHCVSWIITAKVWERQYEDQEFIGCDWIVTQSRTVVY